MTDVDRTRCTFTIQPTAQTPLMTFHWDRATEFFADDHRVKADDLQARLDVRVRYSGPFSGGLEAHRVFWRVPTVAAAFAPAGARLTTESRGVNATALAR